MANGQVNVVLALDPASLRQLASMISGGGRAPAGMPGQLPLAPGQSPTNTNASFMSILKPLVFLEGINKTLGFIFKNSTIANTYMSAMGKVFGAAIDILLIPFIPLFNLLLLGITKLTVWLINSGYLQLMTGYLQKVAEKIVDVVSGISNIAKKIENVFHHPTDPSTYKDLAVSIGGGLFSLFKGTFSNGMSGFLTSLGTAAAIPLGAMILNKMALGIPFGIISKTFGFGKGIAGLFGRGGTATAAEEVAAGGSGGGASSLAPLGLGLGLKAFGVGALGNIAGQLGANALGINGTAGGHALEGAATGAGIGAVLGTPFFGIGAIPGAAIGAGIGAGAGFLGDKLGLFGGGGGGGQGGGMMVNSNNKIALSVVNNISVLDGGAAKKATEDVINTLQQKLGYEANYSSKWNVSSQPITSINGKTIAPWEVR